MKDVFGIIQEVSRVNSSWSMTMEVMLSFFFSILIKSHSYSKRLNDLVYALLDAWAGVSPPCFISGNIQ